MHQCAVRAVTTNVCERCLCVFRISVPLFFAVYVFFFCHCQFVFTVEHSPRFSASFQYCVLESSRSGISFVDGDRAARKMQTVEKRRHVERKSEKRREKWKNDSDERRMHVAHAIHATI